MTQTEKVEKLKQVAPAKPWWHSKTIWSMVLGIISLIAMQLFQVDIGVPPNADAEQMAQYYQRIKAAQGNTGLIISEVLAFIAFAYGIYTRSRSATQLVGSEEKAVEHNQKLETVISTPATAKAVGLT